MEELALQIVERAFANKTDKGGEPYINHLQRVSDRAQWCLVSTYQTESSRAIARTAALLHDIVEDCPEWTIAHIVAIFDDNIARIVDILTKRKDEEYEVYIERVATNEFATAVKLADLEDNMRLSRLPELDEKAIERAKKYHKAYRFLWGKVRTLD